MTWSINDGIGSFLNYHGDQSAGKYLHNHLLKARRIESFHSWCHENILRNILELSSSDLWKICSNAVPLLLLLTTLNSMDSKHISKTIKVL